LQQNQIVVQEKSKLKTWNIKKNEGKQIQLLHGAKKLLVLLKEDKIRKENVQILSEFAHFSV
jgi:hypothetical protein